MPSYIERVESAIQDLKQGKMIILTDDVSRENEGDIIFPAETISANEINFMIRHCSGIICLSLTSAQTKKLGLSLMVPPHANTSHKGTPFTVSIEAKEGVTTGVSAADRAQTILTAVNDNSSQQDILMPGHIFPLQAKDGGVFERAGHTEGAIDIVRLAGFKPAAVLCEVMNPDGTMSSGEALKQFAEQHQIKLLAIEDIISYRRLHENLIEEEVSASLPLDSYGEFDISVVKEKITGIEHIVLSKQSDAAETLVRLHSSCVTGDLFGSKRCDCHQQLHYSLQRLGEEGGVLIYLNQEGRGIGLFNKIKSYSLQEKGMDTVEANQHLGLPADSRKYYLAANILRNRNMKAIRLLTNNPNKISELKSYGVTSVEREAMPVFCNQHNQFYLQTKKSKLNHIIHPEFLEKEVVNAK